MVKTPPTWCNFALTLRILNLPLFTSTTYIIPENTRYFFSINDQFGGVTKQEANISTYHQVRTLQTKTLANCFNEDPRRIISPLERAFLLEIMV